MGLSLFSFTKLFAALPRPPQIRALALLAQWEEDARFHFSSEIGLPPELIAQFHALT